MSAIMNFAAHIESSNGTKTGTLNPLYIVVDIFLIASIILGFVFCISFILIAALHRSCRSVLALLSSNSCLAGLIFSSVQLSNAILLLREDILLTPVRSHYCQVRSYLMYVSGSLLYYSYSAQSISRLFYVVFYKQKFLLTYRVHYGLIAIQWILGFLLPLSILTTGRVQYQLETSQCFIKIRNVSQTLYGMISMFLLPMTVISICYLYIVCYVRSAVARVKRSNALPIKNFNLIREQGAIHIKQRFSSSRDVKVFRHIIILITVLCIGGFPYSLLMLMNTKSIAPFSIYRVCITIFSLSVTADMGAILFFNKNVRTIFFNVLQGQFRTNRVTTTIIR